MKKQEIKRESNLAIFGEYLRVLRMRAGFRSLDSVVYAFERLPQKQSKFAISKSMLSLYERGKVESCKPSTITLLANVYNVSYEVLARKWSCALYGFDAPNLKEESFIRTATLESCCLATRDESLGEDIEIITLKNFEERQSKLPKGSQVGVASSRFLDNGLYFNMVTANIKRGVQYYYLLPEEHQVEYKVFLSKIAKKHPEISDELENKRCHFVSRPNMDFPINYVLFVYPSGQIEGYVGILKDQEVQYLIIADHNLSWRLFESFRWALTLSKDTHLRRALFELHMKVEQSASFHRTRTLDPLI